MSQATTQLIRRVSHCKHGTNPDESQVETNHVLQKQFYQRTSKKDVTKQIVARGNQQENLRDIAQSQQSTAGTSKASKSLHTEEELIGDPEAHHHVAKDQSNRVLYGQWSAANECDAAMQVSIMIEGCNQLTTACRTSSRCY